MSLPSHHQRAGRRAIRGISARTIFHVLLTLLALNQIPPLLAQHNTSRGAMSAQDMARMAMPDTAATRGSTAADQVCARSVAGSIVPAPAELVSQNGVLELTMNFKSTTDTQGLVRYCFVTDTGLEAPTLRVTPGDKLIIHFTNQLSAMAAAASDNMAGMNMALATPATAASACNGDMGTSVTNIHFHGMNVAPTCGQDEVVHTLVQPGQTFDYTVLIPLNEPPGLYWYHPHPHGISEGQVQGGASGVLIVEGLQDVDPALAGITERTFILRDQLLPASESNDNSIPAWDLSLNYVPVTYPAYTPAVIQTNPSQKELWRVANTGADSILDLQYTINGTPQTVQIVAIDGYPIASGTSGQLSENATSILLPPGSRAEFVVVTPNAGDKAQLTTQYWDTGPDGDYNPARPIANIVSQAGIENSTAARSASKQLPSITVSRKVTRFANLATTTPVAQRNLYFSEVLLDPTNPLSPTTFYITEEGQKPAVFTMNQSPNIVVHSGTTEDWVVENRAQEDHIFHIHQLHFQVLEVNGVAVNDPAVRDTVDVPYWSGSGAYPSVKVRMDFRDPNVIGTFVYHCHILEHEDGGMMGEIQVLPAGTAAVVTATASTSSVAPNGNITLAASVIDAATGNPTPTGLVQFELNGLNVGSPAALAAGQATLTTPINGNPGNGTLTAFYEGDSSYSESVSPAIPVTVSNFALTSAGTTAAVGAAATSSVTVNVATSYTSPIKLTCTLPASMSESACFVNPTSVTGTGNVSLIVNTTPSHPLSTSLKKPGATLFTAGGATSLACVCLLVFPRRLRRVRALLFLAIAAVVFAVIGCGGSAAKTDPGTTAGTYTVVVTGTAGTGANQYQASVNVPIIVQ